MPQLRRAVLVTPPRRVVAERVKLAWRDYAPPRAVYTLEVPPRYGAPQEEIDLATPGGRGELLTLAVLEAARVHPMVAADTFLELRRRGLSGATLAKAPVAAEREIRRVLEERYRALADRGQKAEAIVANASRLHREFGGDPKTIFTRSGGSWDQVLRELKGFAQIRNRAHWICREFCRHGIWPRTKPEAYLVVDRYVRTALWRLGFVDQPVRSLRDVGIEECQEKIAAYFCDSLPLFYQGRDGCHHQDYWHCREQCRIRESCPTFLREGKLREIKK